MSADKIMLMILNWIPNNPIGPNIQIHVMNIGMNDTKASSSLPYVSSKTTNTNFGSHHGNAFKIRIDNFYKSVREILFVDNCYMIIVFKGGIQFFLPSKAEFLIHPQQSIFLQFSNKIIQKPDLIFPSPAGPLLYSSFRVIHGTAERLSNWNAMFSDSSRFFSKRCFFSSVQNWFHRLILSCWRESK